MTPYGAMVLNELSRTGGRNFVSLVSSCSSVSADPRLKNTFSRRSVRNRVIGIIHVFRLFTKKNFLKYM